MAGSGARAAQSAQRRSQGLERTAGFTGPSYYITAITQSGTTVTVTTNIDHVFISGQAVMISGVSAGYGRLFIRRRRRDRRSADNHGGDRASSTFTFTSSQSATITGRECTIVERCRQWVRRRLSRSMTFLQCR